MEVQEICRKLKPIIGDRADAYWLAYLAEDYRGKQELETTLRLFAARVLGNDLELPEVHLSAPKIATAAGPYRMGDILYNGKELHPFGLREDELIQHVAVFGRSGAGKTNTIFQLIGQLLDRKKPFLVFDWKRNYRDILVKRKEEILVYSVGRAFAPLAFNPLIPPEGTEPAVWLKKLIEIVAHSYYLGEGVMYLLQEAIHAVYQEQGVYRGNPNRYPTFEDVHKWLESHPVRGRKALWMDSAMRGIKSIYFGHMGQVVNTSNQSDLGEGLIIVDQHPSMISITALGNTYCMIAMNLKHRSDVTAIAAAMLMDNEEAEILGRLPIGEAVVKLQGRWPRPFQIRVPHNVVMSFPPSFDRWRLKLRCNSTDIFAWC